MNFDRSTGIIEMFMESLEVADEGTFTFNLVDGKAKGTTSLVLIGDGKIYKQICLYINVKCGYRADPICRLLLMARTENPCFVGYLLQLMYMSTEGQQKTIFSLLSHLLYSRCR